MAGTSFHKTPKTKLLEVTASPLNRLGSPTRASTGSMRTICKVFQTVKMRVGGDGAASPSPLKYDQKDVIRLNAEQRGATAIM